MNSKWIKCLFCSMSSLLPLSHGHAQADDSIRSMHLGLLYPNGVDVAGYSVEKKISADVYRFYTFGFPSLAAVGLSYYRKYGGDGLTSAVGVGIGSVLYGSIAYQWQADASHYWRSLQPDP